MKHLFRTSILSLATAMIVPVSTHAETGNLEDTLKSVNSTWNQALNSGNAKAVATLYSENATLSPGNGKTLIGRVEIEKLFQSFVDNGVHNHTIEIIDVGGSGNQAYQVAKWSANGAEKDGQKSEFGGILMSVLEKGSDGKWLTRAHMWNARN